MKVKPRKFEGLRFTGPSLLAVLRRKASELDQPGLLGWSDSAGNLCSNLSGRSWTQRRLSDSDPLMTQVLNPPRSSKTALGAKIILPFAAACKRGEVAAERYYSARTLAS
jgi:hypothetical protein